MLNKLGLITINDQMFDNTWWTQLSDTEIYMGQRPIHYFGIFGLVCLSKNKYHLLAEDDGHFWTMVILTKNELIELKKIVSKVYKNFKFSKTTVKITNTKTFLWERKHKLFPIKFISKDKGIILMTIILKGYDKTFDVFWLQALYKMLNKLEEL